MDLKVYALASQLLDGFTTALADTRAGAPDIGIIHPGNMVPQYGCPTAAVRVVTILPVQLRGPGPCSTEWQITYEMTVDRCYTSTPRNEMPAAGILDSHTRDMLEDAAAMRRAAMCAWPKHQSRQFGAWTPRGPDGGIYGGAMAVIAMGVALSCDCDQPWPGIDTRNPMISGDPRA